MKPQPKLKMDQTRMQVRMMMKFLSISLFLTTFLFASSLVHGAKVVKEENLHSMGLELVHKSHPQFTQNKSVDRFEQFKQYARNDIVRHERRAHSHSRNASHRRKNYETFDSPLHSGRDSGAGQYMVQIRVGTPPQTFWLNADTGSDLTWFYCRNNNASRTGGRNRMHRKKAAGNGNSHRVFWTAKSSTYKPLLCASDRCNVDLSPMFSIVPCVDPAHACQYDYQYEDQTNAKGVFATDTITVSQTNGQTGEIPEVLIGCTSYLFSPDDTLKEDGVLGLGLADDTFMEKAAMKYGKKLSYCLVDHLSHSDVSSFLTFGDYNKARAKLLGEMQKTTLIVVPPFYAAHAIGISIDGKMLDNLPSEIFKLKDENLSGVALIDSGSSLALLPPPAYKIVTDILAKPFQKFQRLIKDIEPFEYCFNSTGYDQSIVPRLAFHFSGGVKFEPPVKSYVIDVAPETICFGILEAKIHSSSITIGNIMQQDHLWDFNLGDNILQFAPAVCS